MKRKISRILGVVATLALLTFLLVSTTPVTAAPADDEVTEAMSDGILAPTDQAASPGPTAIPSWAQIIIGIVGFALVVSICIRLARAPPFFSTMTSGSNSDVTEAGSSGTTPLHDHEDVSNIVSAKTAQLSSA